MANPDPEPSPRQSMLRQFHRVMKWMALFSIVIAVIAVLLVMRGADGTQVQTLIATALGVGLAVLLGTGFMSLAFLRSSSGDDEQARGHVRDEDQ